MRAFLALNASVPDLPPVVGARMLYALAHTGRLAASKRRTRMTADRGGLTMDAAKRGDTVTVHYTGRLEDGTVFDQSTDREPLTLTLGDGQVIPGFEEAVIGMTSGETKSAWVPPDKGFGLHREERITMIARAEVPPHIDLAVGKRLEVQKDDRKDLVTVIELTDSTVTLDANHPLAGKHLTFELQLLEVV